MGMLADIAVVYERGRYSIDDIERPTPDLDVHREFHYHQNVGGENIPHTWAEVFHDRPGVTLVAGAERDARRLRAFGERYGVTALYTDAAEMLRHEELDIIAVATNVKGRADLTCMAVECGARALAIEKPIAHTLEGPTVWSRPVPMPGYHSLPAPRRGITLRMAAPGNW